MKRSHYTYQLILRMSVSAAAGTIDSLYFVLHFLYAIGLVKRTDINVVWLHIIRRFK